MYLEEVWVQGGAAPPLDGTSAVTALKESDSTADNRSNNIPAYETIQSVLMVLMVLSVFLLTSCKLACILKRCFMRSEFFP